MTYLHHAVVCVCVCVLPSEDTRTSTDWRHTVRPAVNAMVVWSLKKRSVVFEINRDKKHILLELNQINF